MKILIAEDDLTSRKFLETVLSGMGYEVLSVDNGQAALDAARDQKNNFVIADWMMPGLDGVSLCRLFRQKDDDSYVYFIIVTAKNRTEDLVEGFAAGADDYLIKPFVLEELEGRIRVGERILKQDRNLREKNKKLIELNQRLEELVRIDPLLEIGNRRNFHEVVEKIHDRACRYKQVYGVIMCDIDFFKNYNDEYGHLEGDRILRRIAAAIMDSYRTSDEVFRYGGEEIVVLLPDQDLLKTRIAAERINRDIAALNIEHRGSAFGRVTISCGVAMFDHECEDEKWSKVLERADQALYKAKTAGRNRVCTYPFCDEEKEK